MRLDRYNANGFDRGASFAFESLWYVIGGILLSSPVPGSRWRKALLRAFGARIGRGGVIKPGVRVKFPWRLEVGDHCWIGERVWIDNLDNVSIGNHVCISQGAYLCTGSHDWLKASFDLLTAPIVVGDHAWLCARVTVAPGTRIESGAVLGLASLGGGILEEWTIYKGNPAVPKKKRTRE
jgi:putative colanic acid biosynthesis acetyltransferase WcaF